MEQELKPLPGWHGRPTSYRSRKKLKKKDFYFFFSWRRASYVNGDGTSCYLPEYSILAGVTHVPVRVAVTCG